MQLMILFQNTNFVVKGIALPRRCPPRTGKSQTDSYTCRKQLTHDASACAKVLVFFLALDKRICLYPSKVATQKSIDVAKIDI